MHTILNHSRTLKMLFNNPTVHLFYGIVFKGFKYILQMLARSADYLHYYYYYVFATFLSKSIDVIIYRAEWYYRFSIEMF